jgi:hypothetical protein
MHTCKTLIGVASLFASACRFGEHIAAPPVDSGPDAIPVDAVPIDAPPVFHGMHATIGDTPQVTGSCHAISDYALMNGHFSNPVQQNDIDAGWEFDSSADYYDDATYQFDPNWPDAAWGGFSVRYKAHLELGAGTHCFSIDVGATGTGIIDGKNMCGEIFVGANTVPLAQTGFDATSADAYHGCVGTDAGPAEIDVVFWYFNILEQAHLVVRMCDGDNCTPNAPLPLDKLTPLL